MDKFRPLIIFSCKMLTWVCLIPLGKWKEKKIERKSTRKKIKIKIGLNLI